MQSDPIDCSLTQQKLLLRMLDEFELTREQLGMRLCVSIRSLNRWLLPSEHPDARAMPESGKAHVLKLLELHVADATGVTTSAPPELDRAFGRGPRVS
jgi:hypothetical protein